MSFKTSNHSSKNSRPFRAQVTCVTGSQAGLALFLVEGEYVLGREAPAHFIVEESSISRRHLKFIVADKRVEVFDLGSGNGTYLNGKKIQNMILSPGDRLKIGESEFLFTVSQQTSNVSAADQSESKSVKKMIQEQNNTYRPTQKWRSLLFFIFLGGLIGLAGAQWFDYQKDNAQIALERNRLGDLYDAVMAASSGNYGYAESKIEKMQNQMRHNFLFVQAKDFVFLSAEFEKAETLAGEGKWEKAIATLRKIDLSGVWQEPLSSLKQKKNKRLQAWERQFFIALQKDFVHALEQGDQKKAKMLLEQLGATSVDGGGLSPMKAQLESLLGDSAPPFPEVKGASVPNPGPSRAKTYYSEAQSQKAFSRAIELFRSGSDRQACNNLKQLVGRARAQSVWREKAQSFISRKCMR